MLAHSYSILQYVRFLGQRFFLQFGLHCATHQIRVILISCVVITSLFYPALSIYASNAKSLSVIESFLSPNTVTGFYAEKNLTNLWHDYDTLHVHEDAVSRAKCVGGRTLRVERIIVQSPDVEEDGGRNHRILLSTLQLENRLEELISTHGDPCLKRPDIDRCFVLSPLVFWNYDKETLHFDTNVPHTIRSENVSIAGVPVTPNMVLAGRGGSYENHVAGPELDSATFLALTYFFPESDCTENAGHLLWHETVRNALGINTDIPTPDQEYKVIALEYDPTLSKGRGWTALSAFLFLAYIGFFAYVAWSVRRMDALHSRLGVTFTALVEIAVSTITSLSVCALVGFKVTMVPWELLPIVIVFVGAENMFNLVDAVGKTSVAMPVKQRIAEGLSRAGTSNTLKVVSYNAILGIIGSFSAGAVRQFCIFAIVVLVAHWFLAHTFFMAVLSIDMARLELDELLRRDTALVPNFLQARRDKDNKQDKQPRSNWRRFVDVTKSLLKGRATTNISLLMLLAIAATLYYTTYTNSLADSDSDVGLGAVSRLKGGLNRSKLHITSPAERLWELFNPNNAPLLHLRLESPTIVALTQDFDFIPALPRSRFSTGTLRLVFWLVKIMVLPILATTGLLWTLLLYLLKDTELLEAQRNRTNLNGPQSHDDGKVLKEQFVFTTLPRSLPSDVELIATSKNGRVVVSIGLHNEIIVWRADRESHIALDATHLLLRSSSTSSSASTIVSVTVNEEGTYFAVGTGAGVIAVWLIDNESIQQLPLMILDNSSAGVTEIHFVPPILNHLERTPPHTETGSPEISEHSGRVILLATYENGIAARWSVGYIPSVMYFTPSHPGAVIRSSLLHVSPDNRVLIAFSFDDGSVDLVETGDFEPTIISDCRLQVSHDSNIVDKVYACRTRLSGSMRFIIGVATEAGAVSLWDGMSAECISVLDVAHGRVNNLRITPVLCEICRFCGQLPLESLSIGVSVDHVVQFFNLFLDDQTRRCSCAQAHLRRVPSRDNIGRRSRSNSSVSQKGSPIFPRPRLSTSFETAPFPVSGHGIHSRRVSEKETGRRSSEMLQVPFLGDDYEVISNHDGTTTPTATQHTPWRNAILIRVEDITCERGVWDVASHKFVGIRRRPRPQGGFKGAPLSPFTHGLTTATLERWELWVFDPAVPCLRWTSLASLAIKHAENVTLSSFDTAARLPFTRVSPLIVSFPRAFAGFGNTIGVFRFINP